MYLSISSFMAVNARLPSIEPIIASMFCSRWIRASLGNATNVLDGRFGGAGPEVLRLLWVRAVEAIVMLAYTSPGLGPGPGLTRPRPHTGPGAQLPLQPI